MTLPDRNNASRSPASDTAIAAAAIYPPIGIARLGTSRRYFIGPEVSDPLPKDPGFYRDRQGALKRQAARFRIFGLNDKGKAIAELNASNCEVRWKVHLVNAKAAWYQFQIALDIPEAKQAVPSCLRNPSVADRSTLVIDPGPRCIAGCKEKGLPEFIFDTGRFMGKNVYLGELETDRLGRLLVLGGLGDSASIDKSPLIDFANNERWHDDISDGPVTAEVWWKNERLPVTPAWVVVAPPNFAPLQKSVRTMWDLMRDVSIAAKVLPAPAVPSFNDDILPIFERMSRLQWVNSGFSAAFGWNGPQNFATPAMLTRLSKKTTVDQELRQTIANQFRDLTRYGPAPQLWPWQWGDAAGTSGSPRIFSSLSSTQLTMLQQWAAGNFASDYDPAAPVIRSLRALPVAERPDMLTRAAMEFCVADAFHPGCEMSWPMRFQSMYSEPFRIQHADTSGPEPGYGAALTKDTYNQDLLMGPQYPGGLTRWLAVPWQADAASCESGYKGYDPSLPAFWPAHVPNHVLIADNYAIVMNPGLPMGQRMAAFAHRDRWMRPLEGGTGNSKMNEMVTRFGEMGIIEQRPGPGNPLFPAFMEVESDPTGEHAMLTRSGAASDSPGPGPIDSGFAQKIKQR